MDQSESNPKRKEEEKIGNQSLHGHTDRDWNWAFGQKWCKTKEGTKSGFGNNAKVKKSSLSNKSMQLLNVIADINQDTHNRRFGL